MAIVRTVLGDISPEDLGTTLTHEHTFLHWPGVEADHRAVFDWDKAVDEVSSELKLARESYGFSSLVDATPIDMGRNPKFMLEVARRSGINLISATGFFCESMGIPYHWRRQEIDEIGELFVKDITEGMAGTDIKCGIIKIATGQDDANPHPTPVGPNGRRIGVFEDRVFRAAARTQKRLGMAITTHTDPEDWLVTNIGAEQLDLLEEEGADPSKIIIGHGFVVPNLEQLEEILKRGATVQIDNIGTSWRGIDDDVVTDVISTLVSKGYAGQMVLSFDRFFYQARGSSPFSRLDPEVAYRVDVGFMHREFLPLLRKKGVSEEAIRQIMVENPKRLLAFEANGRKN